MEREGTLTPSATPAASRDTLPTGVPGKVRHRRHHGGDTAVTAVTAVTTVTTVTTVTAVTTVTVIIQASLCSSGSGKPPGKLT